MRELVPHNCVFVFGVLFPRANLVYNSIMKIIELDISKNSKSSFSEETCTNEEIVDLNLDDLDSFHFFGDTEVIDVSEDVEACSFSKTDDFYSSLSEYLQATDPLKRKIFRGFFRFISFQQVH